MKNMASMAKYKLKLKQPKKDETLQNQEINTYQISWEILDQ